MKHKIQTILFKRIAYSNLSESAIAKIIQTPFDFGQLNNDYDTDDLKVQLWHQWKNNKSRISAKELFKELFQLIIIEFNGRGFKLNNDQAIKKKAENGIDWGIPWLNSFDSTLKSAGFLKIENFWYHWTINPSTVFKDIKKRTPKQVIQIDQTFKLGIMPEFVDTQILKRQLRLKAGHLYIQDYKKKQLENSLNSYFKQFTISWNGDGFKIIGSSNSSTFEKFENFLEENKFIKIDGFWYNYIFRDQKFVSLKSPPKKTKAADSPPPPLEIAPRKRNIGDYTKQDKELDKIVRAHVKQPKLPYKTFTQAESFVNHRLLREPFKWPIKKTKK